MVFLHSMFQAVMADPPATMIFGPFQMPGTHPFDFVADHMPADHIFDSINFLVVKLLPHWRRVDNYIFLAAVELMYIRCHVAIRCWQG